MDIDEAREAVDKALPDRADFTIEQEGCDLLLVVRDITISYNELASLGIQLGSPDITLENTTCENGYYGEHRDGQTSLRVKGILTPPPPPPPVSPRSSNFGNLSCSFCGKGLREVKKLIAGPTVYICDECVKLCQGIIDDDLKKGR